MDINIDLALIWNNALGLCVGACIEDEGVTKNTKKFKRYVGYFSHPFFALELDTDRLKSLLLPVISGPSVRKVVFAHSILSSLPCHSRRDVKVYFPKQGIHVNRYYRDLP
jgi:hypothetical protein